MYKQIIFVSCFDKEVNKNTGVKNFYIYTVDYYFGIIKNKNTLKQTSDSEIGENVKLLIIGNQGDNSDARLVAYSQSIGDDDGTFV